MQNFEVLEFVPKFYYKVLNFLFLFIFFLLGQGRATPEQVTVIHLLGICKIRVQDPARLPYKALDRVFCSLNKIPACSVRAQFDYFSLLPFDQNLYIDSEKLKAAAYRNRHFCKMFPF